MFLRLAVARFECMGGCVLDGVRVFSDERRLLGQAKVIWLAGLRWGCIEGLCALVIPSVWGLIRGVLICTHRLRVECLWVCSGKLGPLGL